MQKLVWWSRIEDQFRDAGDINTASITQLSYFLHAKLHDFPHSLRVHFEKNIAPYHSLFSASRHATEKVLFTIDFDGVPLKEQGHKHNCHVLYSQSVSSQFFF